MAFYECARCNYKVRRNSDMIRHLNRKTKCVKKLESYKLNDEEIITLSMILHKDNSENIINIKNNIDNSKIKLNIDHNNLNNLNNYDTPENKDEYKKNIDKINEITHKDNICEYCNKTFSRYDNLKRHQKNFCKNIYNYSENENDKNNIHNIESLNNANINSVKNITNIENQTNNQTNNIIIINANNDKLKPFDGEWTVEHIDSYLHQIILLSETKYTDLLDEILKNKENLNVIIEKDSNNGLVYKNEKELYVNMKVKEIVDMSMQKLYDQLNIFYKNLIDHKVNNKFNSHLIENEKKILDDKFEDFCNNNDTKNIVNSLFTNIYEKNKEEAIEMADKILVNKKIGY